MTVNNLVVFGSGKTTFCQLMDNVNYPYCQELIDKPQTNQTENCKLYRLTHMCFGAHHTMHLIDTPHEMNNIARSFLMIENPILVYLFDLSKKDELDSICSVVDRSKAYFDPTFKFFIGVNRGQKTIDDGYITTFLNHNFSRPIYIEIDLIENNSHKFEQTILIENFNKITQFIYGLEEEIPDLQSNFEETEQEDEQNEDEEQNEEDEQSYFDRIISLDITFVDPDLLDQYMDNRSQIVNLLSRAQFDNPLPNNHITLPKILKNSKFVTQEYFDRKTDLKCCICFDEIKTIEKFVYTWCGHEYCTECFPRMNECFCKTQLML